MKQRILKRLFLSICLTISGCGSSDGGSGPGKNKLSSYAEKPANFRVNLTDKPKAEINEVHVNVKRIELMLAHKGKKARLKIGEGLGDVDLLTLRNGILLPVQDLDMPADIIVKGFRIILEDTGNYIVKGDESVCELKTPSAQQSGLKVNLKSPVTILEGASYSMTIDFDAEKSIVLTGNGGCLLKPVLKLPSFTVITDEGGPEVPVTDGTDESDNNNDGDQGGGGIDETEIDPDELPEWFLL